MRRLVWWSSGYIAGATSSWWVQRKVRRTAERVLPEAVRNEVTTRLGDTVGSVTKRVDRVGKSVGERVGKARDVIDKARPGNIDLRDRDRAIS